MGSCPIVMHDDYSNITLLEHDIEYFIIQNNISVKGVGSWNVGGLNSSIGMLTSNSKSRLLWVTAAPGNSAPSHSRRIRSMSSYQSSGVPSSSSSSLSCSSILGLNCSSSSSATRAALVRLIFLKSPAVIPSRCRIASWYGVKICLTCLAVRASSRVSPRSLWLMVELFWRVSPPCSMLLTPGH